MTDALGPIGIFDSGIGGLTIASAVRKYLPNHSIVYFGDTAHLPYGDKSVVSIQGYIRDITTFLAGQKCSHLVVACNSASSVLTHDLIPKYFTSVINVIDPVVNHLCDNTELKKIGVIGTRRTIKSNTYKNCIHHKRPDIEVVELETPLLAPMIEEGFIRHSITSAVINEYLEQLGDIDALVLGCTHYPLIRQQIADFYGPHVRLYDAPDLIASQLKNTVLPNSSKMGDDHFYVSDHTKSFEDTAHLFFGETIELKEKRLQ
jgi:glutamate racemase